MTDQIRLSYVWADGNPNQITSVDDTKYALGWVNEIPTFQNFNYSINLITGNLLSNAEAGAWKWQDDIAYANQAVTISSGGHRKYLSIPSSYAAQDPQTDSTVWGWSPTFGPYSLTQTKPHKGMYDRSRSTNHADSYNGASATLGAGKHPRLVFEDSNEVQQDMAIGMTGGKMVVCELGVGGSTTPDGRNLALGEPYTFPLFHEGNEPDVSQVVNAVPETDDDGKLYARKTSGGVSSWTQVTATTVSAIPPSNIGAGAGWYNTIDGQLYVDVNDGDSNQWVVANPTTVPDVEADKVSIDPIVGMSATDVQAALEELYALATA